MLYDLEKDKPTTPKIPKLIYGDATPEALKWILANTWSSLVVLFPAKLEVFYRNAAYEFIRSPDPSKFNSDLIRAVGNTNALASHIISALKLSGCNEADQAAALMEAMRFVGRLLTNNHEIPCSQATAMCLATINPIYARPQAGLQKNLQTHFLKKCIQIYCMKLENIF